MISKSGTVQETESAVAPRAEISPCEFIRLRAISRFEKVLWDRGITAIAGVDEAGRGPLAGPVVAAAVVLAPGSMIAGIDDSKKLTPRQRERIYDEIIGSCVRYGVAAVGQEEIDRLNILQATIDAMNEALHRLENTPEYVLSDGNFFVHDTIPSRAIVGGDGKSISIGAASIVAKVTRDRIMMRYHEQYPEYGFDRHKGYGTAEHIRAIGLHGYCPIHRRSFHLKGMEK